MSTNANDGQGGEVPRMPSSGYGVPPRFLTPTFRIPRPWDSPRGFPPNEHQRSYSAGPNPHQWARSPNMRHDRFYNSSPRGPGPRGSGYGRGYPRPKRFDQYYNPHQHRDSNPGGSDDITKYYNKNMLMDPWQALTPVPVTKADFTTT